MDNAKEAARLREELEAGTQTCPTCGAKAKGSEGATELQRALGRLGAHQSWANTVDRSGRTAPARAGLDRRFLDAAGGDPEEAARLKKLFYTELGVKSAAARKRNREQRSHA